MWRRNRANEQGDRQARIRELERELGIEAGPESKLTGLSDKIETLSARREEIQAASKAMSSEEQRRALTDVERQLWQAIQEVADANQMLSAQLRHRQNRVVGIDVHTEAGNQWLVQVRTVDGNCGAETVREFRVVGRQHREVMRLLSDKSGRAPSARQRGRE